MPNLIPSMYIGLNQILDAIQSKRPFYDLLSRLVLETNHELWMNLLKAFYNKRFKSLSVASAHQAIHILRIVDLLVRQKKKCGKYGLEDGRFDRGISDLLSTVFTRTFQNMMPLILGVLEKMKSDYTKEKETICMSYGRPVSPRSRRPVQVRERGLRHLDGMPRSCRAARHPQLDPQVGHSNQDDSHLPERVPNHRARG